MGPKVQPVTAPAKAAAPTAVKKEPAKAKPEVNKNLITTRHLADQLGVKPAALRRYLRTLPHFQDETYTRYKWDPANDKDAKFLSTVKDSYAKHAELESEKNKKRIEGIKAKQAEEKAKPAPVKGQKAQADAKKAQAVAEDVDEVTDEPEDEEEEEDEDL